MDHVTVLRRFNRSFTQRIGVLDESFLGTGRPLGPSRVLFEIDPSGIGVADLRRRLGLDSGYLSRLLRQLEADDLVTITRDPADGRRRVVRLTARGRHEWRRLDRRSQRLASGLVEKLSDDQRVELARALTTADRLLRAATVRFDLVDPRSAGAQAAMSQYFAELDGRFPSGFDPGDGAGAALDALAAPAGAFVVLSSDGMAVGCGGLHRLDDDPGSGEIKRMWIHPEWRGLGLGCRLLAHLEWVAADHGFSRVLLDTNDTLVEAIRLYERAGYRPVERYNDNPYAQRWFVKDLEGASRP